VTVIRTSLASKRVQPEVGAVEKLLLEAQRALPKAHVGPVTEFKTASGLAALRVEADFVPTGQSKLYHRVHSIVIDGTTLIHVLYTAATPDPGAAAVNMVVDTIHEEGEPCAPSNISEGLLFSFFWEFPLLLMLPRRSAATLSMTTGTEWSMKTAIRPCRPVSVNLHCLATTQG
jgi:hypothetical protein